MKKVIIKQPGGFENIAVVDLEILDPKPNEITVRWRATSLNYHDYLVALGAIPVPEGRVPMSDGAGEVVAVGETVTQWKPGDQVMSLFFPNWLDGAPTLSKTKAISGESVDGYIAEYSNITADSVTAIPKGYTYAEAATLPCACLTAWRALFVEGNIQAGDKVLIEGSGGMSLFALQLAQMAGAEVYATTSQEEKADHLKALGGREVVNYKQDDRWGKTIFKMTDGGVDHVLDVGGGSTMKQSIEAAAIGGRIYAIGILGNGRKGEITFPKLFFKHLKMIGLAVGSKAMQEKMVRAIEIAEMKPIIDRRFAFGELAEAFQYQSSGVHFGKIVLEYD